MLPDWETLQKTWPLLAALAALWARLEVARALGRAAAVQNVAELARLDAKVATMDKAAQNHAVQLGRIEEALKGVGHTLERIDRKIGN
ncbi:MAG: hypothetical protein CVT82_13670 [Alphaproteobacteria bacterium HGW-Alphaproteobacteria-4]|jgi:hypothetical protein|nr:MAG: hypothetical protein CVT82_13670 [Alphaproteobacteria bacterium HGW-Alphaproteobacteria-4]